MGRIAEHYSDHLILTSDNSRTESVDDIVEDIVDDIVEDIVENIVENIVVDIVVNIVANIVAYIVVDIVDMDNVNDNILVVVNINKYISILQSHKQS